MGLIYEKYYFAFKAINKVRNNYPHKYDYKVSLADLSDFKFDWLKIQHQAFRVSCDRSVGEGASIATIFLCWKETLLISKPASPYTLEDY